jgi:hypothetical protein
MPFGRRGEIRRDALRTSSASGHTGDLLSLDRIEEGEGKAALRRTDSLDRCRFGLANRCQVPCMRHFHSPAKEKKDFHKGHAGLLEAWGTDRNAIKYAASEGNCIRIEPTRESAVVRVPIRDPAYRIGTARGSSSASTAWTRHARATPVARDRALHRASHRLAHGGASK